MCIGKIIRLGRITENGKMICVPMDHGVSMGPIKGLKEIYGTIEKIEKGGATSIIVHKGVLRNLEKPPNLGLIMHLSASTDLSLKPNFKVQVSSIEEAIRLGADAVSVHVNIGAKNEHEMLVKLGRVADECDRFGLPLIAMMYARGEKIKDKFSPSTVSHITRIAGELGADIVKTTYTGTVASFKKVVESSLVPVVIAGGPKQETVEDVFKMVKGAMDAGAAGITFGRNIFQAENPTLLLKCLRMIILENASVKEALEAFKNE